MGAALAKHAIRGYGLERLAVALGADEGKVHVVGLRIKRSHGTFLGGVVPLFFQRIQQPSGQSRLAT